MAQSRTSDRLKRLLQQPFRVGVPTYPKKTDSHTNVANTGY
ncbi:hypothetical protein [Acetobacter orientalis]|nr:hypothetical protein [Acetobacter orientalis]